jgi:hypothetical protein
VRAVDVDRKLETMTGRSCRVKQSLAWRVAEICSDLGCPQRRVLLEAVSTPSWRLQCQSTTTAMSRQTKEQPHEKCAVALSSNRQSLSLSMIVRK